MADEEPKPDGKAKKKGGLIGALVPVLVLTLVAAGGGYLVGKQIVAKVKASAGTAEVAKAPTGEAQPVQTAVRELPPIVANLAAPEGSWVRLQTAIVYEKADAPQIEILSSKIADDSLAFLRTLSLTQLQGASGLQHLREDLSERAAVRSEGHIKEMMIEMMVIQ